MMTTDEEDSGTTKEDTGPAEDLGGDDDTGTPPEDNGGPPDDDGTPPEDDGNLPDDSGVPPMDSGMMMDGGAPTDTPAPTDRGPTDVPSDRPTVPGCPTVTTTRTDPCPGVTSCGLPSSATVRVTGATSTLTEHQVQVTLPPSVRSAVGSACDRMVFRASGGAWAPHWVQDCAMGTVWVRVPTIAGGTATTLTLHYGGSTAVAAANSYDDTFDRVPLGARDLLGAWTFDEGTGATTCPSAGAVPFDAYIHYTPYNDPQTDVTTRPELWSTEAPPSILNASARFTRGQHSLNFPRHPVTPEAGVMSPNRLVNWQTRSAAPFNTATRQLTVGLWVYAINPANTFGDNFQTVVCQGMPELSVRQSVMPDANVIDNSIFNSWAIFFRSDNDEDTYFQGNSCVAPCTHVDSYAHITTREPLPRAAFAGRWHFLAITVDTTTRPHATRRSYYDGQSYQFPTDLDLFPEDVYCPMGPGHCNWPPEAPIQYYPAPIVLGADMNDGEPQLGLEGRVDDLFIINRAISPDEMRAYRERRRYTADALSVTVTP